MYLTALLTAVLFVVTGYCSPSNQEVDSRVPLVDRSNQPKRVLGVYRGKPANIRNYPYMAAIYSQSSQNFIGNGVILNSFWILVTAYEVDGYGADELGVRVGSNDALSGGQTYNVSSVVVHSDYTRKYDSDVALMKTATNIIFTSTVTRATLAYFTPSKSTVGIVTGYGSIKGSARYILREANFTIINYDTCVDYYNFLPTSGLFCARSKVYAMPEEDIGSPIVTANMVAGNLLGGYGRYPTVYNTILIWKDWINNQIKYS